MMIMMMMMIIMLMMIISCCRPTYLLWFPLEERCPHAAVCHRFAAARPAHGAQSQPQVLSGEGEQLLYKLGVTVSVNYNHFFLFPKLLCEECTQWERHTFEREEIERDIEMFKNDLENIDVKLNFWPFLRPPSSNPDQNSGSVYYR